MSVKSVLQETEVSMQKAIEAAKREFSEVRTGRAHPGIIEGLHVDYFGTPTLVKQLAAISIPDSRTIMIQPWDASVIPELEKAIANSSIGIAPSNDGKVLRLNIPTLSEERRLELQKIVKEMAEKGRVSLRTIRREANDHMKKLQADKVISEDEGFKGQEDIQKLTDKYIKSMDVLLDEKSKALLEVH